MFQERIREHYENLTPGFRKLADYVMNHTLDAAFMTATELSRRVDVDPATVVRFSQELGYSGYRELSREVKRYVRHQVTATYRQADEAEGTEALLQALIDNAAQNIQYFTSTDLPQVAQAVELLKNANVIWFTGEYTGYDIAQYMTKKFQSFGRSATAFHPSMGETASVLTKMQEGDVLLAFAGTEVSLDTGYTVRMAREKGLKTITVGASGVILPAREAEISIIVPSKSPTNVPSFGPLLQVMALLWEAVMQDTDDAQTHRQHQHENMEALLKLRAETPEYEVASPQNVWNQESAAG